LRAAKKRYCPYCGAPVQDAGPPVAAVPASVPVPLPVVRRKAFQPLVIGGVVVGVLVVVVAILFGGRDRGSPVASGVAQETSSVVQVTTEQSVVTSDVPDAATVVENYYAAVNQRDYRTAWQLGGVNLDRSYSAFVDGYATTVSDDLTILGSSGDTVDVGLTAQWSDGSIHHYSGSYTVSNGQIVSGSLRRVSG
jgi:hypothetical protein